MTKTALYALLANDDLDAIIIGLVRYAEQHSVLELRSDVLIQSGRLEEYKKQTRIGATAYETLSQQRAAVRSALMEIIEALPEQPLTTLKKGKLPGVSEQKFKSSLFWLVLSGNFLVLMWLWFQSDTGGFSPKEIVATLTILISVFSAYLMPMFSELVQNRHINLLAPPQPSKRVRWSLPLLTCFCILPTYFGLMLYFIHLRGLGKWHFDDFTTALTLLVTGFGAYLATLVNVLFKKAE
jgi:hypothetical protein